MLIFIMTRTYYEHRWEDHNSIGEHNCSIVQTPSSVSAYLACFLRVFCCWCTPFCICAAHRILGVNVWDGVQQRAGAREVDAWEWECGMEGIRGLYGVGSACVRVGVWDGVWDGVGGVRVREPVFSVLSVGTAVGVSLLPVACRILLVVLWSESRLIVIRPVPSSISHIIPDRAMAPSPGS